MLHLILGRAGFGKTHRIYSILQNLSSGRQAILLVPEQYSFESERAMLSFTPDKRAEVLSFSRLCHQVFKTYGGVAGTPISEDEKLLLMTRAIRQTAQDLHIYRRQAKSMEFVKHMMSVVKECSYAGIKAADLVAAAVKLPTVALKNKVEEIALIAAAYEALLGEAYIDPDEELNRLYDLLNGTDFWRDKTVLIDSFKDFTAPQKKLLKQIIASAKDVYVTLCADGLEAQHNLELFANTKGLAGELIRFAGQSHVQVAPPEILTKNYRAKTEGVMAAEEILAGHENTTTQPCDSITICACSDKYDEAEFVAASVCRLVREEKVRYRDITVIARDTSVYEGVLDAAFERYGIPCFSDNRRPILHQPLIAYVLKAVELCAKGFDSSLVLSFLKTGLWGYTLKEIAALENYVFTWSIKGRDWLKEFTHHPDGMGVGEPDEKSKNELNRLRVGVVAPLLALKKTMEQGETAKDLAAAVYEFLVKTDVYPRLQQMAQQLEKGGNPFEGEDVLRSFELFVELLDRMVSAMGKTPLTVKEFYELLTLSVQSADMGKIPQGIDQVVIGSADRTRPASPKAVFILGANQGVFPATPASGGLLTDRERKALNQADIPLSEHAEFDTVEEIFLFYNAACSADEKLFFTYLTADKEKTLSPANALLQFKEKLQGCVVYAAGEWEQVDPLLRVGAVGPAFDWLAAHYKEGSALVGGLYHYFQQHAPHRLQILKRLTTTADCSLQEENAEKIFGKDIFISPSGVEVYHKCAFSYFCRYGLRINPRKPVSLDVLSRGTIVHYVLEHMLLRHGSKGLYSLSKEQMQSNIHSLLTAYVEEQMGGLSEKAYTFRFQLERIEALLVSLLAHMAQEMKDSGFETAACELAIGPNGDVTPMTIPLPNGGTLSVVGVVDRLDVYEKDGITYFRVVDYKTGTKTFDLDDIYYGIGLQMLIYLYSVEKNGERFGSHRSPAGVLYMPARRVSVRSDGDEESLKKDLAKTLKMKGLVLDDPAVIHAMDPHACGVYMPLSFKKDGSLSATSSLASMEFFGKTRRKIEALLGEMGKNLQTGAITCDPLDPVGGDACGYCDYKAVCPLVSDKPHRKVPALTAAQEHALLKGGEYDELSAHTDPETGH